MSEAKPSDLSIMPFGMCASQLSIGRPKMRNGMPLRRKCAAIESPYGPAPMMAVFNISSKKDLPRWSMVWVDLGDYSAILSRPMPRAIGRKWERKAWIPDNHYSRNSFKHNEMGDDQLQRSPEP